MKATCIHHDDPRTFVLVFETGDTVEEELLEFARSERIEAAHFTAIGAFSDVTLGFFDLDRKDYLRIPVREQVEVVSLTGNIARHSGAPRVHAHVVVGLRDGTTRGGHLMKARVRPTLEVVLIESPGHLRRRTDRETGLALIDIEPSATASG
jgi:hypothetical protein